MYEIVSISFKGGIISPGQLLNILIAVTKSNIKFVRFGLRQQLLIDIEAYKIQAFTLELDALGINYEVNSCNYPNIISSYPAEEIFIRNTWLTEDVYKDILDAIDFKPSVKVNLCNSNQSFTPMLTGNMNWIASTDSEHYWHLIIRFPKTNVIFEWGQLCYTNSIPEATKRIAKLITENLLSNAAPHTDGAALFLTLVTEDLILKDANHKVDLPAFNLPYYEGLNRYSNRYWLGIYSRDELFGVGFLKKMCEMCLVTKLGQLCCTPWKSIIIKGINEKDKMLWSDLLETYNITMRHAANELNFQVEDNCEEGLMLKNYLVKFLSAGDTRTSGICFGIKTRRKSEVFSSILIRRRHLINFAGLKLFAVYDILCAKDFNPNERTGVIFSAGNPKFLLPEQLRRSVIKFYNYRASAAQTQVATILDKSAQTVSAEKKYLNQCINCFSVYNEDLGETDQNILPGTLFKDLPESYCCPLCETEKKHFLVIDSMALGL
jgi:rubredoxin